jgi:hypothetical protein
MPIAAPEKSPKRELGRKLFDAALSGVPFVGGPLRVGVLTAKPGRTEGHKCLM